MFRRREKVSLQRLNQIFSPRALSVESSKGVRVERTGSLRRQLSKGARTAAARARKKLQFGHSGNGFMICACINPISVRTLHV